MKSLYDLNIWCFITIFINDEMCSFKLFIPAFWINFLLLYPQMDHIKHL